jgi:uncharacterized Zn finger protein
MARQRHRGGWGGWTSFPKSTPIQAKGGIKAQSKKGSFGESWWAKRWIDVLHGFNIGARLDRGRSYARRGQVLSIEIEPGQVQARVQGSRPRPYDVTIKTRTLTGAERQKLAGALGRQALFAAKLLAGEMPHEIEEVFRDAGLALFPARHSDLTTACSCPDSSNPCKHIAAVYYLLGEEFDRDPFLLFTLRGVDRAQLVAQLVGAGIGVEKAAAPEPGEEPPAVSPEPFPASAGTFWTGRPLDADLLGPVAIPAVPAALPRRLGNFPFWRGDRPLIESVEPSYVAASPRGLETVLGRQADADPEAA